MCNALSSLGRYDRAVEFADLALQVCEPKNKPVCLYSKAVQLEYQGNFEGAYQLYKKTGEMNLAPKFLQVRIEYAESIQK
jgi:tetratricopeptide (TPR) repeat protein